MENLVIAKSISEALSEFQVFPYGEIDVEGESPAYLDEEAKSLIINEFNRRGNDMVIDYEHQTLKDIQAPAAGWVRKLVDKGAQGLWAVVDWTAKAKKYLKDREYRYFSPVFSVRKDDRKIVALKNVALTNSPLLNHLQPIIAKYNFDTKFDPVTLQVAKIIGNTEEDLIIYGGHTDTLSSGQVDQETANLEVAKMMGNTEEDILQYGQVN